MSALQDKKLKMPKVDLKKKPTYELLTVIGKQSAQDITPHPFTKLKKPREEKVEEIFIKQSDKKSIKGGKKKINDSKSIKKINKKQIKKKFKKKS
tara:strand:- start:1120 stop:1404 length:285 start_codon:yes stop_codon:yes gene_type:complete